MQTSLSNLGFRWSSFVKHGFGTVAVSFWKRRPASEGDVDGAYVKCIRTLLENDHDERAALSLCARCPTMFWIRWCISTQYRAFTNQHVAETCRFKSDARDRRREEYSSFEGIPSSYSSSMQCIIKSCMAESSIVPKAEIQNARFQPYRAP